MKEYRFYIVFAVSAACHAAGLLTLLSLQSAWSYTPAWIMLRDGDNAVTTELLVSVEAVAGPTSPAPTPVTQTKQAIRRQVENAAEQLAAAVRELSKIKLPDPPRSTEPKPSVAELPTEPQPSEPFVEPVIEAVRMRIDHSATNLSERMRDLAETVQEASRQCAAQQARRAAARQEQAEQAGQIARAGQPAGAPALPPPASKQTRGQGNADVNSRASNGGSGTQGVSGGTRGVGSLSPIYPPICRRRGEEGKVMLQWQVLASGRCGWVKVVQSSGYELLDQAAVEAVKNADFHPAASAGRSVDSVMACTFRFTLTDAG